MDSIAVNFVLKLYVDEYYQFFCVCLGVELLNHGTLNNHHTVFQSGYKNYNSISNVYGSPFLHIFTNTEDVIIILIIIFGVK